MDSTTNSELNDSSNPISPNSVLQEQPAVNSPVKERPQIHGEPPLLRPLRLRAIGKLRPIDVKHLSFHLFPVVLDPSTALTQSENEFDELELDSLDACMILQPVSLTQISDDLGDGSKGFEDNSLLSMPSNSPSPIAKAQETPSKLPGNATEKKTNEVDGSNTDTKSSKRISPTLPLLRLKAQPSSPTPTSPSSPMVLAGIPVFLGSPRFSTMEAEPIAYAVTIDQSSHVSKPSETSLPISVSSVPKAQTLVPPATPVQSEEPKTPIPPVLSGVFSTRPLLSKSDSPSLPPWPSRSCVVPSSPSPPPPPPSPVSSSVQPLSFSSPNGFAPPPPPPLAAAKAIRAKKNDARLKRSTQMGKLYRALKGKVEGSSLDGKALQGRKNQIGNSSGGNKAQGMADALAEMTKRLV